MNTQSGPIFEDGTPYTCDYLYSRTRDGKWFVDDAKVQKYCKPGELGRMQARDAAPQRTIRACDSQKDRIEKLNTVYRGRHGNPMPESDAKGPTGKATSLGQILEDAEKQRKSRTTDSVPISFRSELELQALASGPVFFGSND